MHVHQKLKLEVTDSNAISQVKVANSYSSSSNEYYSKTNYHPTREQLFKLIHTDLDIKLNWKKKASPWRSSFNGCSLFLYSKTTPIRCSKYVY